MVHHHHSIGGIISSYLATDNLSLVNYASWIFAECSALPHCFQFPQLSTCKTLVEKKLQKLYRHVYDYYCIFKHYYRWYFHHQWHMLTSITLFKYEITMRKIVNYHDHKYISVWWSLPLCGKWMSGCAGNLAIKCMTI